MIDPSDSHMSIREQCELLGIHRSLYYYQAAGESNLNLELMRLIDEIHLLDPNLGYPRMRELLQRMGYQVSKNRVARLMRTMGIRAHYPAPKTSNQGCDYQVFPYLLKGLKIIRPNQVWCADITYIPVEQGFFYLVAIMDWFSRYVLAWELSNSMETQFCLDALSRAFANSVPEIFNTDQGSQFTSNRFTEVLTQKQIQVSHDGKGRFVDNIFIERLWRSLKYEEVYPNCYRGGREAYQQIGKWFRRYNQIRSHQSLDYYTPEEVYFGLAKRKINISQYRNLF